MRTYVDINETTLKWAIARAGFELNEFLTKFPKVSEWLNNEKKPTLKQLEKFSHSVHIPFGYLFLSQPPTESLPIPFFRTDGRQNDTVSLNVYDTILLIQQRQEWLREYLSENDFETLPFVGRFRNSTNVQEIVNDIRRVTGLAPEWAHDFTKYQDTLNFLVAKIEELGIIVISNGVVENNTKRPIKVEECRGFVLVDNIAPFMFINAADAKAAQLFTVVHELAHIWTGHSAGFDFRKLQPASDPIEKLCDQIAAEFLVPTSSFLRIWNEKKEIGYLARYFKVSPIVIARRALDLGKINRTEFFSFYTNYISQLNARKENQPDGGDFFATTRKRLSVTFAAHIHNAVRRNKLLYRDAYKLTSLKGDTFHTFFDKHLFK